MMKRQRSRGFSLVELLTVVAIIGVLSLVGVPAFINYQRSQLVKNSLRMYTSDLRAARSRAVANTSFVRVRITTASPAPGQYVIEQSTDRGATYPTVLQNRSLEQTVYFDTAKSFVFQPNGTVEFPVGVASDAVEVKSDARLPKPAYTVTVSISGKVAAD
ncbi:MAG TPA: prepilin-type N-terminal cleavage/methylation domain-containing protein [Thermoanaerobaculia bacterium]|nr:prepilin-type N-terminal cleavage/methylation domain-containing protein [Thermoanaerobaculia bacterium]